MSELPARVGVERFINDLNDLGISAQRELGVVKFEIEPIDGARAGQLIATAVSESELLAWPAIPPHWVHFPADVVFAAMNIDVTDCLPGWHRHSRDLQSWSPSDHPGQAWTAHVRSVLTGAI